MPKNPNTGTRRSAGSLFLAALLALVSPLTLQAKPLASSVTVLTREDFARHNFFSLGDVLDRATGINVERTAYRGTISRARLRGLPQTQSLVIAIDGRALTHSHDGAVDLSAIPLNMVERIEITRGGGPLAYGPGAAGVVNLITARPTRSNWLVDIETAVGRDGVRQHNGRFLKRLLGGDASYIAGLQDSGGFTHNDESEFTTHFFNFTRAFRQGGYWGIEYAAVEGRAGTPEGTTVPLDMWNGKEERVPVNPTGLQRQESQTARFLGASPLVGGGTFHLDLTRSLRESEFLTARDGAMLEDQDNNTTEGRLRYERRGIGIGVEGNKFNRRLVGAERREATQTGAFAEARIKAGEFELSPGVRFDRHSRAGGGLTARTSAVFRPIDTAAFSASIQRGSRFPTFEELFPVAGPAATLDPERVTAADAGVAYEGTGYRVALTGFDTRIKDAIAFDSTTGVFGNAGEDRTRGVEIEMEATRGEGKWREIRLAANGTAQNGQRKEPGASQFLRAPLSPRRIGIVELSYRLPWGLTMTNELRYESEQFEAIGETGRRLPPFAVWNLRFEAAIHSARVFLAAENLGGRRYAEAFGSASAPAGAGLAPQPTRTFWTGVSLRFLD